MGDHHRWDAVEVVGEQRAHLPPCAHIERSEGLVEQQQVGAGHQRTCQRHPLLLSAGEVARSPISESAEVQRCQHRLGLCMAIRTGHSEGDIVPNREVREQPVALRHVADVAGLRRQGDARVGVQQDPTRHLDAALRWDRPGEDAEERGLAGTVLPDDQQRVIPTRQVDVQPQRAELGRDIGRPAHRRAIHSGGSPRRTSSDSSAQPARSSDSARATVTSDSSAA